MTMHRIVSDDHIVETVHALELALADARAGKLSFVVVFGDMRGENCLKTYKSALTDRVHAIGMLMSAIFDMCCEFKAGGTEEK